MARKWRSMLGRIFVWMISALLIVANLVIGSWYWRTSESLRLQKELKRLSALVSESYNTQVRDARRLREMTHWIRDKEDFPITSGNEIVACTVIKHPQANHPDVGDANRANEIRALVYIPPGNHRLKYSFKEFWTQEERVGLDGMYGYGPKMTTGWEKNAVTVNLPTGVVHEVAFSVEQEDENTVLRVSVTGHHQRTFPLPSCVVLRQQSYRYFNKAFPNQHLNALDEDNPNGIWRRMRISPNDVLYGGMTLQRSRAAVPYGNDEARNGELRLYCWIESDVPESESAVLLAAHGKKFIDRQRVPPAKVNDPIVMLEGQVPEVDEMFEPYDGSGNLYYEAPPVR